VPQRAAPDAVGNERPHAALVPVALGDDGRAHPERQRRHFEVRRRSLDLVDQAEHVGDGEVVQAIGERPTVAPRGGEPPEQLVERLILAEEEELVLAAEVVIQVGGGEVGRDGDVAHAGRGEAVRAERPRGGPQDLDAPRIGAPAADRTTVRKLNHRSILPPAVRFLNVPHGGGAAWIESSSRRAVPRPRAGRPPASPLSSDVLVKSCA